MRNVQNDDVAWDDKREESSGWSWVPDQAGVGNYVALREIDNQEDEDTTVAREIQHPPLLKHHLRSIWKASNNFISMSGKIVPVFFRF